MEDFVLGNIVRQRRKKTNMFVKMLFFSYDDMHVIYINKLLY